MKPTAMSGTGRKARIDLVLVDANNVEQVINLGQQNVVATNFWRYTVNQWVPLGTKSTKLRLTVAGLGSTAQFDGFTVRYTTGNQLIDNRHFTDTASGVATVWSKTGACYLSATDGRPGAPNANAVYISPNTGNYHYQQDIPLAEGQRITIRGYMKTVNMAGFSGKITLICQKNNTSGGLIPAGTYDIATQTGTADYGATPFEGTVTAPAGTVLGLLRLQGIGGTGCTGSVYFDDISVIEGDGKVKAFPGAEGFGENTPGARGPAGSLTSDIIVYRVTSLNNNGTGSVTGTKGFGPLRWILENSSLAANKRIFVVFPRAGIIDLTQYDASGNPVSTTPITTGKSFLTIAGQTAPGGGICLKNAGIRIKGHDIIMRGLRVRPGGLHLPGTANLDEDARDCLSFDQTGTKVENLAIDHCSFAWSTDEQIEFYVYGSEAFSHQPIENITLSNCIFTEPCDSPWHMVFDDNDKHHAYQMSLDWVKNMSLHHNLFVHGQRRQPEVREGSEVEIINNLVYNYEQVATEFYGNSTAPKITKSIMIGNLYMAGPQSTFVPDTGGSKTAASGIRFNAGNPPDAGSKFYLFDNYGPYRTTSSQDEWAETTWPTGWNPNTNGARVANDFDAMTPSDVTRTPSSSLLPILLGTAGKQFRPGAYPRDAIDARAISDVLTNTGNMHLPNPTLVPDGLSGRPLAKNTTWRDDVVSYRMHDELANNNGDVNDDWNWNNGDATASWQGYNTNGLPDGNANNIPDANEDSDSDGVPNVWETNYAGDAAGFDALAVSADGDGGYLNLEVYLNSLIPPSEQ